MTDELKPGQKFPTPTPGCGDRVFYESLYKARPDSCMAQEWCVNYGVLPHSEAAKLAKKIAGQKKQQRLNGGGPSSPAPKKKKQKARIVKDEGVDPDMQVSSGEGIGSTLL